MSKKVRIAYIETFPEIGGGQNGFIDLISNIDKEKFEPVVIVPSLECKLAKALLANIPDLHIEPLTFDYFPFGYNKRAYFPLINPIGYCKLKSLLKKIDPDVIHANQIFAGKYSLAIGKKLGVPSMQTMRNVYYPKKWNYNMILDRKLSKNADYLVFNSETGRDVYRERINLDKIIAIRNAIKLELFTSDYDLDAVKEKHNIPKDKKILLAVGTLSWSKGHYLLIDVFSKLLQKRDDIHLVIVGEEFAGTGERENLLKHAADCKVLDKITFTGRISEMTPFYKMAYCNILPSIVGEGLPRVLMESDASGTPAIASDISGVHEAVVHNRNGFLVEAGNADNLQKAVSDMLELSEDAYNQMKKSSVEIAEERFCFKRMIKSYEDLYTTLAEK